MVLDLVLDSPVGPCLRCVLSEPAALSKLPGGDRGRLAGCQDQSANRRASTCVSHKPQQQQEIWTRTR